MRIIAGRHRGRRIAAPPGRGTRPMLDRVREALFSILQGELEGAHVLDLFAGSGNLGLEALSRGAERARFVERHRGTAKLLEKNARELGELERAVIVTGDALQEQSWGQPEAPHDVVFLDPPYPMLQDRRLREGLLGAIPALLDGFVGAGGVVVYHAPRRGVTEAELAGGLDVDARHYGTSTLWFVRATPLEQDVEDEA